MPAPAPMRWRATWQVRIRSADVAEECRLLVDVVEDASSGFRRRRHEVDIACASWARWGPVVVYTVAHTVTVFELRVEVLGYNEGVLSLAVAFRFECPGVFEQ